MSPLEHAIPPTGTLVTEDLHVLMDEKAEHEHIQDVSDKFDDANRAQIPISAYVDLLPWQAIRKFRRQFLFGVAACLGALSVQSAFESPLADYHRYIGYCNAAVGNIVANPGS